MSDISVDRLFELYYDAIKRCTSKITSLSDEEIEYNLYEEFDIAAISFFHVDSLTKLFTAGLINEEAKTISQEIRKVWIELQKDNWNIEEIKNDSSWKHLFSLCDKLLSQLSIK